MFTIMGQIDESETIARGRGVRNRVDLRQRFGPGAWRKMKGTATVRLIDGRLERAEVHWYEAHGTGRRLLKIKRFLDRDER